ncbi:MAG: ammonia-forming cytochrome c nitrite reductase [Bacteroidetes bacterium HGW-Bacteroidetes-1]|jgi:nitrite reductase (cytochrome c-552)|nr:MAG: ammonia-forming cytochrome c nitrite reductase [Bacteroidetes bacterium HGW-Bacteroidetes-1]
MNEIKKKNRSPWVNWTLFAVTLAVVFFLGLLVSSITERRAEAIFAYAPKVKLNPFEPRNEIWGKNFPWEFESYRKTQQTDFRTQHGGNAMRDVLEESTELVVMWAGYGFSKDYNQGRGHSHAIEDIQNTLRTGGPLAPDAGPMPSTCWACKSPDVPRLMNQLGGPAEFYKGKWAKHGVEITNSIGCADCHNPETMDLAISRPALIEAFQAMNKDITKATHQEMRSLVCAQCHVEYYFNNQNPEERPNYLTFPWVNGFTPEAMLKYYDDIAFSDWTHALSKTPMLKAQHPDYEVYTTGIHAERGVSCADCHMPYVSEGGLKYSNHHVTSPLKYISQACQTCHRESEETLLKNVYDRQNKVAELRHKAENLLTRAHVEAKIAWDNGTTDDEMKDILYEIRAGQWFWDYVAASHGGSFHSPLESARVMGKAIDHAQSARIKLARLLATKNINSEIPYPDITTKAKAQEFIGLPMDQLKNEKKLFLEEIIPVWKQKAKEREATYDIVSKK